MLIPGFTKVLTIFEKGASSILYAITDKRVLIVNGANPSESTSKSGQIISIAPKNLREREVEVRADDAGDIIFPLTTISGKSAMSKDKTGFYCIPKVKEVESILTQIFGE